MSGLCPRCGIRPKGETKSGNALDYCHTCQRHRTIERQQAFKSACLDYTGRDCYFCGEEITCDAVACYRDPVGAPTTAKLSSKTGAVPLKEDVRRLLDGKRVCCTNCERLRYRCRANSVSEEKQRVVNHLGGSCVQCGEERAAVLDVHHKDGRGNPIKSFAVGDRKKREWSAIAEELTKCELLCANCHSAHHFAESEKQREREKFLIFNSEGVDMNDKIVQNDGGGKATASDELVKQVREDLEKEDGDLEEILNDE